MAVIQLFYNPWTKNNFGVYNYQKKLKSTEPKHDNHLHVACDNAAEMREIIDTAKTYGLKSTENPYSKNDPTGKVEPEEHAFGSLHTIPLNADFSVGAAVDINGSNDNIVKFITLYLVNNLKAGENSPKYAKSDINKFSNIANPTVTSTIQRMYKDAKGLLSDEQKKAVVDELKKLDYFKNMTDDEVLALVDKSLDYLGKFAVVAATYYATQSGSHTPDYFTPNAVYQRLKSAGTNESILREDIQRIKNLMK